MPIPAPSLETLPLLLALGSALFYGAADFAGGIAARRASGLAAAAGAQGIGLIIVAALASIVPATAVTRTDLLWGVTSGLCGGSGLAVFFAALARGRMSTVAPITAVIGAGLPVAVGLGLGERPTAWAMAGIALAGAAIILVSKEDAQLHAADDTLPASAARTPPDVLLRACVAGALFGGFFTALSRISPEAGLWPLLANRAASSVILCSLLAMGPVRRREGMQTRGYRRGVFASGVLDVGASVLFMLASSRGMLSLVAPLGALYPASTVLLAVLFLKERLGTAQKAGLVLAGAALLLIAA